MNAAEGIDVPIEGVLADGTPVKAKCRYRAKDISVEMLSPYPGQHAGRHIMFMSPRTYTANEYWKTAAWELLEEFVARGRWISSHPDEVGARRREAKRRIGIVQKYVEALAAERKAWKRQLKDGSVDQRTYQLGIAPINKAIRNLELIAFEQEESNWLRNGIVEPFSCSARPPGSSRRTDMKNVNVYLRDSALVSKREDGWRCVLETQVPKADLAGCGLGLSEDNPATLGQHIPPMSQSSQKTYAYDDFDRLGSDGDVAYTYDAAGNVTRIERDGRPTLGLVWNSQYQLVSVSTNGVFAESYTYDAPRRRELRKVACGVMYLHLPKRGSL